MDILLKQPPSLFGIHALLHESYVTPTIHTTESGYSNQLLTTMPVSKDPEDGKTAHTRRREQVRRAQRLVFLRAH